MRQTLTILACLAFAVSLAAQQPPELEDSSDFRRAQEMGGAAVPQHCSATQGDSARSCQGRGHTTVKQRRTIRVLSRLTTTPEPNIDAMDAEDATPSKSGAADAHTPP